MIFRFFKVLDEIESKTEIHKENEELSVNEKDEETDRETQITTTTNTAISKADQRAIDLVIRENKRKRYLKINYNI